MLKVHKNKDKSIHGTYKSKDITLKLLLENRKVLGEQLKKKVELFQAEDDNILQFSFDCKTPHHLKLEKSDDEYKISLTKYLVVKKDSMTEVEKLLLTMAEQCTEDDNVVLTNATSSSNLLHTS